MPTEFYDGIILQKIGVIGRLLKVDAYTSSSLRERYAWLCIEIPMDELVKKFVYIETHKKYIQYEAEKLLCKKCGRLGHQTVSCTTSSPPINNMTLSSMDQIPEANTNQTIAHEGGWFTVPFSKVRKSRISNSNEPIGKHKDPSINAKLFNVRQVSSLLPQN